MRRSTLFNLLKRKLHNIDYLLKNNLLLLNTRITFVYDVSHSRRIAIEGRSSTSRERQVLINRGRLNDHEIEQEGSSNPHELAERKVRGKGIARSGTGRGE